MVSKACLEETFEDIDLEDTTVQFDLTARSTASAVQRLLPEPDRYWPDVLL